MGNPKFKLKDMITNARIKTVFEKLIDPLCYSLKKYDISPNSITITGFLLLVLCAVILGAGYPRIALIPGIIGGIFDAVDGKIARDKNKCSLFGAFLDSFLDRVAEIAIAFGYIAYYYNIDKLSIALIFWILMCITASLMVSYTRGRAEGLGLECKGGFLQRQQRGVIVALGLLLGPHAMYASIVIIALLGYLTVFQRALIVYKASEIKRMHL